MPRPPTLLVLALYLLVGPALAAGPSPPNDLWELQDRAFQGYSATVDSPLVVHLLHLPVTEDLASAETARVALYIVGRSEEASLLQRYMENDVIAGLLQVPRLRVATVEAAITQQRGPQVTDLRDRLAAAHTAALLLGGRSSASGLVYLPSRKLAVGRDSIVFGYPAGVPDSPRQRAHQLVTSSTCWERRHCSYRDYLAFANQHHLAERAALVALLSTYSLLLLGGATLWLRPRWMPRAGQRFARLAVVPGALHLAYLSLLTYTLDVQPGEGAAAGVGIVPGIVFIIASLLLLASIGVIVLAVRPARTPDDPGLG